MDAVTKRLVEVVSLPCLPFHNLPREQSELMDADLNIVVDEAERILHVTNSEYLAQVELQSTNEV